jgi:hypothetical protein
MQDFLFFAIVLGGGGIIAGIVIAASTRRATKAQAGETGDSIEETGDAANDDKAVSGGQLAVCA